MNCGNESSPSCPVQAKKKWRQQAVLNVRSLPESSPNAEADACGPCFPLVMPQKALSTNTSNVGIKPALTEIFCKLLAEYGEKIGVDAQWQAMAAPCRTPPDALSKNQLLRSSGASRRTEDETAARFISIWTVRAFLCE